MLCSSHLMSHFVCCMCLGLNDALRHSFNSFVSPGVSVRLWCRWARKLASLLGGKPLCWSLQEDWRPQCGVWNKDHPQPCQGRQDQIAWVTPLFMEHNTSWLQESWLQSEQCFTVAFFWRDFWHICCTFVIIRGPTEAWGCLLTWLTCGQNQ